MYCICLHDELYKTVKDLGYIPVGLGKENFKREILCLCKTRGDTNYMEAKIQFDEDVLLNPQNYNGIIAIKIGYGSVKNLSENYVQSK